MPAVAIVQARMGSSRLPGKSMMPVAGHPMLWHIVNRVRQAPGVTRVVVATSDGAGDEPIRAFCMAEGIDCFAGSENDVIDRFFQAAKKYEADPILRITADCPFADPSLIGKVLAKYAAGGFDYVSSATGSAAFKDEGWKYPDGLDVEVFGFGVFERAHREATVQSDREHVTPYLYRVDGRFRVGKVYSEGDWGALRWTVDHAADLEVVRRVYDALFSSTPRFGMRDILAYFDAHPELKLVNEAFVGHEGYGKVWNPDG